MEDRVGYIEPAARASSIKSDSVYSYVNERGMQLPMCDERGTGVPSVGNVAGEGEEAPPVQCITPIDNMEVTQEQATPDDGRNNETDEATNEVINTDQLQTEDGYEKPQAVK